MMDLIKINNSYIIKLEVQILIGIKKCIVE